jgi:large-conductance mechanosensitive channel
MVMIATPWTHDFLMPLLNPFIRSGNWRDLNVPYYGGNIAIGSILDVILNSLIVGWVLFLLVKTINRSQRAATTGVNRFRPVMPDPGMACDTPFPHSPRWMELVQ